MTTTIYHVDAFTDRPFSGNPAGVCVLPAPCDDVWMQNVAAEMGLPETAFLWPLADAFSLRWFTPLVEVELCGHATLASAHILWQNGHLPRGRQATFHTRSGLLRAQDFPAGWIELDFPALSVEAVPPPPALLHALHADLHYCGRTPFDYLVEVASEQILRELRPDLAALERLDVRGCIVTSRSANPHYDFVSRFFAPSAGIPEDPVTGSAHCALAPFWGSRLSRREMLAFQASRRGGVVHVHVNGDRVALQGQAVTVLRCELTDAPAN